MNEKLHRDYIAGVGLFGYSILISQVEYEADMQVEVLKIIWNFLNKKGYLDCKILFVEDRHKYNQFDSNETEVDKSQVQNLLTNKIEIFKKTKFLCL